MFITFEQLKKSLETLRDFVFRITPQYTSDLVNDSGYVKSQEVADIANSSGFAKKKDISQIISNSGFAKYEDIPTNLSGYYNDVGYITSEDIGVPDWNISKSSDPGYINNKPLIKSGSGFGSLIASTMPNEASGTFGISIGQTQRIAQVTLTGEANTTIYSYSGFISEYEIRKIALGATRISNTSGKAVARIISINTTNSTIKLDATLSADSAVSGKYDIIILNSAEGTFSTAIGASFASGDYSHAEGQKAIASDDYSHQEGVGTVQSGPASHAEGDENVASAYASHAEGHYTAANGDSAHQEGLGTTASSVHSHQEGHVTVASGDSAHQEGYNTTTSQNYSHSEGFYSKAEGIASHQEGDHAVASGMDSHAEGKWTIANHLSQHVFGMYNVADQNTSSQTSKGTYVEIVGKGTADNARSNARTLDWSGNEWLAGTLKIGGTGYTDANAKEISTKEYVDNASSALETSLKTYTDDALSALETSLKQYIDNAISTLETSLKQYIDTSISSSINAEDTALKQYVDDAIARYVQTTANMSVTGTTLNILGEE